MTDSTGPDWPRPIVAWQIETDDIERLRAFYRLLFGWIVDEGSPVRVKAGIGGPEPGPAGRLVAGDAAGAVFWVQVRDLRASLAQTAELGGRVVAGPEDLGSGPTVARIEDPDGNPFVLVQQ